MELFFSKVRTATTNLVEKIRTMEHFVVILVWTFVFIVLRLFNSTQTTGEICSKDTTTTTTELVFINLNFRQMAQS